MLAFIINPQIVCFIKSNFLPYLNIERKKTEKLFQSLIYREFENKKKLCSIKDYLISTNYFRLVFFPILWLLCGFNIDVKNNFLLFVEKLYWNDKQGMKY